MNRKIIGYQILSEIYESSNSLVFRGYRESDNQPVILKILKEDYPTPAELTRYKQEYEITRSLNLDSIIKVYDLQKYQNTLVMILEDFGGNSLKILMAELKITLEEFLRLGIKISEILSAIHAANIIHKDINPSNIVFNPETGILKIIDFGISTVLLRENPTIRNPNVLEGTLAYISPEQTGRMNRALDYRTDFYSLGATFYEMLTQKLPFETTDAMELVHCHIAKEPIPPHEQIPEIPLAVSAIVMKLLAKTAEERYQSAWGLKSDLELCLNQLQTTGHISNFSLGAQDISDKFQIPQKLYGREREIETLLAAFDRVADSATENSKSKIEMMLVAGYSGIGKSVLVQEIYKPITQQKGYFSSGKFDQFQRNIPYSAVVRVFSELVRQILTESESQLNNWREKLLAALGQNGQVIIDVIPEVELIVGKQPPVQELGPTESQNRFNLVFQNFIQVFCQKEHPLVIFLDDLQWADSATLKLIQLIMTDENMQYLLMIGAYRDNEVSPTHPLMMTLDGLRKSGAIINQIILTPLEIEHINQILVDTLKCDFEAVKPLGDLLRRKTNGNPFFVNQFLKTLYQENLLTFSVPQAGSQGKWQWSIAQIEAMDITENVVELMLAKLKKFAIATQQVLRLAACVGNRFQLATLAIVNEKSAGETFRDLKSAIQEGLVIPTSELEIAPEEELQISDVQLLIVNFKFLHDRVQQAAYALIDDEQKKAVHLKIGRLMLEKISPQERDTRIFEVADHLNVGRELVADSQELNELANLNLEAGKKAKDATAYAAASQYLTAGLDCLRGNDWDENYDLTLSLYKDLADVEYLKGNFEQSEALINQTLERTKSALEKAEIYKLLIVQYTLRAKPLEAIQTGRKALKLVGVELPEEDLQTAVSVELAQAKENLNNRDIASFIDQQEVQDPEKKVALQLLANLAAPTFVADQALFPVVNLKASNLSLKYGPSSESPIGYANHGLVLVSLGDYQGGYQLAMLAQKLTEKTNNLSQQCKIAVIVTTEIGIWVNHLRWADPILDAGYYAGLQSGELQWAGYILKYKLLNAFFQGKNLENLAKDIPNYLNFNEKTENNWAIDIILSGKAIIWNLTGIGSEKFSLKTEEISSKEQYIERCKSHQSFLGICTYNIFESQALYLYGKYSEALQSALAAEKLLIYAVGHNQLAEQNFYSSLILASLYPDVSESEQKQYWNKLESNQGQMKIWADNCPENNLHKYLLVAAEMARIAGENIEEVLELYDRAIASANENDFIQNEALACELAARFWLSKNKEQFAKFYMQKAEYGYLLWGAKRKVEDLQEKYPQLVSKSSAAKTQVKGTKTTSTTGTGAGEALDLATVVKASQAIAGEIVLDKLLAKLTNLVLENAGAQKGFLILSDNGILKIQAQGEIEREVQVLQSLPVSSSENLPLAIINYVARTQENVVLSEATREGIFTNDPYILAHQPKSILCSAIVNQGKLTGILYLENNIAIGAFTPERLEVVKILSSQAAISLENAILYRTLEQKVDERTAQLASANQEITVLNKRLKADNIRMSAELDVTRRLQQMILPKEGELSNIPGLDIAGFMEPADEVGGDYYDVLQYGDRIKIGIGDVTGHGLESGVLMIMAQTAVRTLMVNNETDPVRFLNAINCTLYDNVNRMNCDRNLSLCLLDYEEGTLRLSGQHEEVIVVRCSGEVERIDTMDLGFPIALDSDIADFILSTEVHLNPGDVVVLYTDGITEAKNEQGLLYGVEPLIESICRNRDRTAEEIRQAAIDDLRHYIGEQKVFDDITLVILKQK
ncbi:AAA family ATPase [Microcoleus sp. BR0-C5]|uniref:AAA family ATPase n=1 Tax=Microcoleus sp. BR0-C5 TaxID=2818713 RepID=UPI002FCFE875